MYPIILRLQNSSCLVVGGGKVAERKVRSLLEAGAEVTIISPEVSPKLNSLHQNGNIQWFNRVYQAGDLKPYRLIIAATNDHDVNRQIFEEANTQQALINSVDDPENCNFYVPALLKRGQLMLAISTSGAVPALAKALRRFFEKKLYPGIERDIEQVQALRRDIVQQAGSDEGQKKQMYKQVLQPKVDEIIEKMDEQC
jgi:precorrin-2 dehydrogenase/sirohydrochlorin ferrochelatase